MQPLRGRTAAFPDVSVEAVPPGLEGLSNCSIQLGYVTDAPKRGDNRPELAGHQLWIDSLYL